MVKTLKSLLLKMVIKKCRSPSLPLNATATVTVTGWNKPNGITSSPSDSSLKILPIKKEIILKATKSMWKEGLKLDNMLITRMSHVVSPRLTLIR